ncbi:hypothetical protein [Achromobacter xylosoxidans]|uniref:Uncharacterized protein n=1 Tax=Alcaligenes xylosoxydans xylosoxydans TaxID=85698 RepID=A0A424W6R7_ALCXX|nr:hypothetical protein [Achromobacter xylosoxidans]MBC9907097.1 hypothetical protein [Achromobacter xylosoxidans]MBD0872006.1 hypothetical protein [Achromobacter xylosoxidans]QNP83776.1 hypothetical protein IAG39_19740 [Achromobacter xylosoxidans]RPJ88920.1 hypothetical protein DY367_25460 [Achromobacter xylosoxidans]
MMKRTISALALCLCGGFAAAQNTGSSFEVQEPMRDSLGFPMGSDGGQEWLGDKAVAHMGFIAACKLYPADGPEVQGMVAMALAQASLGMDLARAPTDPAALRARLSQRLNSQEGRKDAAEKIQAMRKRVLAEQAHAGKLIDASVGFTGKNPNPCELERHYARQFLTKHKDGAMKAAPKINQLAREVMAQDASAKAKPAAPARP